MHASILHYSCISFPSCLQKCQNIVVKISCARVTNYFMQNDVYISLTSQFSPYNNHLNRPAPALPGRPRHRGKTVHVPPHVTALKHSTRSSPRIRSERPTNLELRTEISSAREEVGCSDGRVTINTAGTSSAQHENERWGGRTEEAG